jgi:hypothetical protein
MDRPFLELKKSGVHPPTMMTGSNCENDFFIAFLACW